MEISAEAHLEGMKAARPGRWEYEVEAAIEHWYLKNGAMSWGYPSIVGSGPNATVLHYDKARRRMVAGELVVVDVGAEFGYYSADVTRTWPVSGRFTPRQRRLYDLVLGAQEAAGLLRMAVDRDGDRALVEVLRAALRDRAQRGGVVGQAHDVARLRRLPVGREGLEPRREERLAEEVAVEGRRPPPSVRRQGRHGEAALRVVDRRGEDVGERELPVARVQVAPRGGRAARARAQK